MEVGTGGKTGRIMIKKTRAEHSSERPASGSKHTQAKEKASPVFPPSSNLQETNSWFLFSLGFVFVFAFVLQKGPEK